MCRAPFKYIFLKNQQQMRICRGTLFLIFSWGLLANCFPGTASAGEQLRELCAVRKHNAGWNTGFRGTGENPDIDCSLKGGVIRYHMGAVAIHKILAKSRSPSIASQSSG